MARKFECTVLYHGEHKYTVRITDGLTGNEYGFNGTVDANYCYKYGHGALSNKLCREYVAGILGVSVEDANADDLHVRSYIRGVGVPFALNVTVD